MSIPKYSKIIFCSNTGIRKRMKLRKLKNLDLIMLGYFESDAFSTIRILEKERRYNVFFVENLKILLMKCG